VEVIGFVSITTALDYYEQNVSENRPQDGQFWVAVAGAGVYISVILLVNAILDGGTPEQKIATGLLCMMAVVGGLMVALRNQLQKRRNASADWNAKEIEHQHRMQEEDLRMRHEERMKRIEAKATQRASQDVATSQATKKTTTPDTELRRCACGYVGNRFQVSSHQRWCAIYAQNKAGSSNE
jgi:hypothetical protein